MSHVVAAVGVGEERFGAVADPFHRTLKPPRGPTGDHLLGVEEDLRAAAAAPGREGHRGAEAATDARRDDAQLVPGRNPWKRREPYACHVWVLSRDVEC